MKRNIDLHLERWITHPHRKPVLLRGARQVGKTFAARTLAKHFESFVEVNFERQPKFKSVFDMDLDPKRILRDISLGTEKKIQPGSTLLFLDEIQEAPQALTALRYLYEEIPELHVIAAGSLLDFTIENIGIPVGRVSSLYVYPLSFIEFLMAGEQDLLIEEILQHPLNQPMSDLVHDKLLSHLGEYFAIGGMPEAVHSWFKTQDPSLSFEIHHTLLDTYRQDFHKYANKYEIKYVATLFEQIPQQLGHKFKYARIHGEYRKRELSPCLNLLNTAGVVHNILHSDGQGAPIGAQSDPEKFKVAFLDIALCQALLGLDLRDWFLNAPHEFINKGEIVEAFIGQEILAYSSPIQKSSLYYWQRNTRGSEAEVDYLIQLQGKIIPIEVKSGKGTSLKSMHSFLQHHPNSPYGLRFSTLNYSKETKLHSYPLYALAAAVQSANEFEAIAD